MSGEYVSDGELQSIGGWCKFAPSRGVTDRGREHHSARPAAPARCRGGPSKRLVHQRPESSSRPVGGRRACRLYATRADSLATPPRPRHSGTSPCGSKSRCALPHREAPRECCGPSLTNGVRARDCAATCDVGRVARAEAPRLASACGTAAPASRSSWPSGLPGERGSSHLPQTIGLPSQRGSSYLPKTVGLPSERVSSYDGRRALRSQLGHRIGRLSGHCDGAGSVAGGYCCGNGCGSAGGHCCGNGCGSAEVGAAWRCR